MTNPHAKTIRFGFVLFVLLLSTATGFVVPVSADATCSEYPISAFSIESTAETPLAAVEVSADTTLADTDTLGNNPGEPYLQVDIDGSEIGQTRLLARSEDYSTTLRIPEDEVNSLEPGRHTVTVILWDQDGEMIDETDVGNDDPICEVTKTFEVEQSVESEIHTVDVTETTDVDGDGYYSTFTLEVQATTVLERSDTTGNNPGEPYFQVEIGDEIVRTTDIVSHAEDETYAIELSRTDLEEFEHGTYGIEVELWDKDGDNIDRTDAGNDDDVDQWTDTISLERPLSLRASRSSTIVGSPVAFRLSGATGSDVTWKITDQPSGNDAALRSATEGTVSLRPTAPGEYTISAIPEGDSNTQSVTVTVSDSSDTELLKKYAPRIHYRAEEAYHPTRYEAFIYNSELQQLGEDNIPNPTVFDLPGKESWELDLKGSTNDYPIFQDEYPPTVYGSVHDNVKFQGESYRAVTYWLFYTYDPKQVDSIGALFAHQSDLETVTILLQDGKPKWVGASQHRGGELRTWSEAQTGDSHLKIYPALGAHSNYLHNTENYEGEGIPMQAQFLFTTSMNTSIVDLVEYFDKTGSDEVYANDNTGDVEYQLVPLTGDELWADYEGTFGPNDDAGALPFYRERWTHPGRWMETHLPTDEAQTHVEIQQHDLEVGTSGVESSLTLVNNGAKPHPVWVVVEAKPTATTWDSSQTKTLSENRVYIGVGETKDASVQTPALESNGEWNIRVRLTMYPPSAVEAVKALDKVVSLQTITVQTPTPTATPTPTQTATPTRTAVPSMETSSPISSSGEGGATSNRNEGSKAGTNPPADDSTPANAPGFAIPIAILSIALFVLLGWRQ